MADTATPKRTRRKRAVVPERCPACASAAECDCVKLPEEFRAIGFSGLFHAVTDLEPGAYDAFKGRVPCLIGGDRWVLASVDEATMTGVVVRKDSIAIMETLTRPGP